MPDAGYLTIGKVVKRLQGQYPDLSISKVRYLEDEGLLNPSRTPSGYRLYSQKDVHRLETILYLQKNRFMPLSVIKQQLDGGEGHVNLAQTPYPNVGEDDEEVLQKFHPIDRMPELLGVCDRILVMSGGRLAGEVDARNTTQEEIMTLAAKYV